MTADVTSAIIDLVSSNPQLAYLCKSIVHGDITAKKGFLKKPACAINSSIYTSSWIRVCRLNKPALVRYARWYVDTHYGDDNKRGKVLTLFNKFSQLTNSYRSSRQSTAEDLLYCGCNVWKDLKINGYCFNICDFIDTFIVEGRGDPDYNTDRFLRKLYKVIYVGEKNFFVGFIDNTAVMYLDEVILDKVRQHSETEFQELIKRIISVYANANSIFFDLHTVDINELISSKLTQYLTTRILNCGDECSIIPPDHIDVFNDYNAIVGMIEKLKSEMDSIIKKMLENTCWGVNSQYSYKKLIDDCIRANDESMQRKVESAFSKGMMFGNKVETCGWSISEQSFDDAITWEKEVEIVPVRFYYNRECYRINNNDPEWKNPFKITKLYVTAKGTMRCEGYHPNTNNGNVCMGDISGKIVMSDIKKLQQNLTRCESLLYTINYDSPYDSSRREELIKHSVKEGTEEFNSEDQFVSTGAIIQEVNFEDEPEEDFEEVPDDTIQLEVIGND